MFSNSAKTHKKNVLKLLSVQPVVFQSGETEPLDLGAPISSLDGLRVVLEQADPASGKGTVQWPVLTSVRHSNPQGVVLLYKDM